MKNIYIFKQTNVYYFLMKKNILKKFKPILFIIYQNLIFKRHIWRYSNFEQKTMTLHYACMIECYARPTKSMNIIIYILGNQIAI